MNNRERAELLIRRLNALTLGDKVDVEWNTPRAFMLESYQPGTRRIYQVCRNSSEGSGQSTVFSGTAPEVCTYVRAMLDGFMLGRENRNV